MVLLTCLWQDGALRTLGIILIWPILHYAMVFCLQYATRADHASGCGCVGGGPRNVQSCDMSVVTSVRAILAFLHSISYVFVGISLLLGNRFDVASHAIVQITSASFYAYSCFWHLSDLINYCPKDVSRNIRHGKVTYQRNTVLMRFLCSFLSLGMVTFGIRSINREMTQWSDSVVPVLMDMHTTSTWQNPSATQRRTLAFHLLSKPTEVGWLFTLQIILVEIPGFFLNLATLLKMQASRNDFKSSTWTRSGNDRTNAEMAAAMGAAAWRRERGGQTGPAYREAEPESGIQSFLQTVHLIIFSFLRVLCGIILTRQLLGMNEVVQDTSLLAFSLLNYAMGLYQFGGVVSYATKSMNCHDYRLRPRRSLSWRLMTCCNDEWLR